MMNDLVCSNSHPAAAAAAAAELKTGLLEKTSSSYQFMRAFASSVTSEAALNRRSLECISSYSSSSKDESHFHTLLSSVNLPTAYI